MTRSNDGAPRPGQPRPRPRIEPPAWMRRWPPRLQPHSIIATAGGVELCYRSPDARWLRIVAGLRNPPNAGARTRAEIEVRPVPGCAERLTARLARATATAFNRSPEAGAWVRACAAGLERLTQLRHFGGPGAAIPALARADTLLRELVAVSREQEPENPDGSPAVDPQPPGDPAEDPEAIEIMIVTRLFSGQPAAALLLWHRHRETIEAGASVRAQFCTALLRAATGEVTGAREAAQRLTDLDWTLDEGPALAAALDRLGHPDLALTVLEPLTGDDTQTGPSQWFGPWHELGRVAIAAGRRESAERALAAALARAASADERLAVAQLQRDNDQHADAEATLERLLAHDPGHRPARHLLAELQLWRNELAGATTHARALVERDPEDAAAWRVLGASELLAGRPDQALAHLDRALALEPDDYQAYMWRAETHERRGALALAQADIGSVQVGDFPAWQVLRALIEERSNPGSWVDGDIWFIADLNIQGILGERAPANPGASHASACAALRAALEQLGGNRSMRATAVVDGRLRWLDGVQSPRQRAEQLQLEIWRRGLDEVLADFESLARRHPSAPFFETYAAELALWLGQYERALDLFLAAWEQTRTRWGYVGSGAAAMLLGDDERALALWREGARYYPYLDAEATYCYRGELLRKRGQLDDAREDLELAVRARRTRLGAWVNLALLHHARGDEPALREAVAEVESLCPPFAFDAALVAGVAELRPDERSPDALARMMTALLDALRGNRSSVLYTTPSADGRMRVLRSDSWTRWCADLRPTLDLLERDLVARLAAAPR